MQASDPRIHVYAGPDEGLYDALNKLALTISSGYFFVIGSGDKLLPDLEKILTEIRYSSDCGQVSYANAIFLENKNARFVPSLDALDRHMSIPHPGFIMPIELFRQLGGFDTRYRISADYDLIVRARFDNKNNLLLRNNNTLVSFKGGGMSEICSEEAQIENALIQLRNGLRTKRSVLNQLAIFLVNMQLRDGL